MFCSATTIVCIPTEQIKKRNPSPTTEHKSNTIDNVTKALTSSKDDSVNSLIVTYIDEEKCMKEELKRWRVSVPIPIQLEIYGIWLIVLIKLLSTHFIHIKRATLYTAVGCMESCKRLLVCSRLVCSKYVVVHSDCGVTVHKETEC